MDFYSKVSIDIKHVYPHNKNFILK